MERDQVDSLRVQEEVASNEARGEALEASTAGRARMTSRLIEDLRHRASIYREQRTLHGTATIHEQAAALIENQSAILSKQSEALALAEKALASSADTLDAFNLFAEAKDARSALRAIREARS